MERVDGCDWLSKYVGLINFAASGGRLTSVANSPKLHCKFCNIPLKVFKASVIRVYNGDMTLYCNFKAVLAFTERVRTARGLDQMSRPLDSKNKNTKLATSLNLILPMSLCNQMSYAEFN